MSNAPRAFRRSTRGSRRRSGSATIASIISSVIDETIDGAPVAMTCAIDDAAVDVANRRRRQRDRDERSVLAPPQRLEVIDLLAGGEMERGSWAVRLHNSFAGS